MVSFRILSRRFHPHNLHDRHTATENYCISALANHYSDAKFGLFQQYLMKYASKSSIGHPALGLISGAASVVCNLDIFIGVYYFRKQKFWSHYQKKLTAMENPTYILK